MTKSKDKFVIFNEWLDTCPFGNNYTYGYGDSLDRERVRDILLENPNLSWSN